MGNSWKTTHFKQFSVIRLSVLLIWIIILSLTPYHLFSRLPETVVQPWGLGHLILGVPQIAAFLTKSLTLSAFKLLGIVLCVICAFQNQNRGWAGYSLVIIVLILDAVQRAYSGYINHAQIVVLLFLIFVVCVRDVKFYSLARIFGRNSVDEKPPELYPLYGGLIWMMKVVMLLPYTFIGLNRLLNGGTGIFTGDSILTYITFNSLYYSSYGFDFFVELLGITFISTVFKAGFFIVTLLEVFSAGVLFSRRYLIIWMLLMTFFHISTLFTMNILFWENIILLIALFYPEIIGTKNDDNKQGL